MKEQVNKNRTPINKNRKRDVKESIRKDILKKAIKLFGKNGTIKKLNRLIQMHSNNNPKAAAIFHNDMLYIKTLQ